MEKKISNQIWKIEAIELISSVICWSFSYGIRSMYDGVQPQDALTWLVGRVLGAL